MILKRKRNQYQWIWLSKREKCEEKLLRLEILEHKNDSHMDLIFYPALLLLLA